MEIFTHTGNLLDVQHGIIVHGCNSKGVMGSGIAKDIKAKFPQAFNDYSYFLGNQRSLRDKMGAMVLTTLKAKQLYIANIITQENYGTDKNVVYVDYKSLAKGLKDVSYYAQAYNLDVHFPLIGCGLANGDWQTVEKIINQNIQSGVRKHLWVLE